MKKSILLATAYWALAAWPAQGQQINACVNNSSGTIHVGVPCQSNEVPLSWNIQGPPGVQGVPGLPGSPGIQGPPGETDPLIVNQFNCAGLAVSSTLGGGQVLSFGLASSNGAGGLSTIGPTFSSFVVQPGVYQLQFMPGPGWVPNGCGPLCTPVPATSVGLNGNVVATVGQNVPVILQVSAPNTTLQITNKIDMTVSSPLVCQLVIVQMQ